MTLARRKKNAEESAPENEEPAAEEPEEAAEPSAEELVDSELPVESLLDYTDEDKPLSDLLVDDKDIPEELEEEPENPETEDEPEEKPAEEQVSDKFPYGKFVLAPDSKKEETTEDSELPQEPVESAQAADAQNNESAPQEQEDEPQAENETGAAASEIVQSLDSAKQQLKEAADEAEQKLNRIAGDIQEKAEALQNQFDSLQSTETSEADVGAQTETVSEENAETAALSDTEKYTRLLSQVENILPVIGRMLENKELAQKFDKEILLFKQLRELGGNLPDESKQQFMTSKTRLLLDFLIARLSGKPGLLKTSKSLRKSGVIDEIIEETAETDISSLSERTEKVILQMRELAKDLPDKAMAKGLLEISDGVLKKQ